MTKTKQLSGMQLAIFDLDGTLVPFHRGYLFEQTASILKSLKRPPVHQSMLEECFAAFDYFRFVIEHERESFMRQFWELFDHASYPAPQPFPGVVEMMQELRANGVRTALVTARASSRAEVQSALECAGLGALFDSVRSREDQSLHWQNKQPMIELTCRELGVDPQQALMVGDIPSDVTSARAAGLGSAVAVTSGGIRRDVLELSRPDLILDKVTELIDALIP